ncbi:MAG: WD40 repeat domain-containing protein [Planctomycetota bacterium]|nr:WD40 repeat domain-containing protein [Planctomycetota bacterium]MDA1180255.1 WD40 repeat domain-containing protein [Planctomycetota bacterium]
MSTVASLPAIDPQAMHLVREWRHTAMLLGCRFDPSGQFVFGTSGDYSIQRWPVAGGEPTRLDGHTSWLHAIEFSPDGATLFTAGYDGKLIYWDAQQADPRPQRIIDAHQGWIRCLAVHPEGQWLATGGNDQLIRIWSTTNGQLIRELQGHESHIYSLVFHSGGELLAGDLFGNVFIWNVETGARVRSFEAKELHTYTDGTGSFGGIHSLALTSDGNYVTCTGLHEATNPNAGIQWPLAIQFNLQTGTKSRTYSAKKIGQFINYRGIYLSNGDLLCGLGKHVAFWRPNEEEPYHSVEYPAVGPTGYRGGGHVLDVDIHPDQTHIATAHFDGHLRISKLQAAEPKAESSGS